MQIHFYINVFVITNGKIFNKKKQNTINTYTHSDVALKEYFNFYIVFYLFSLVKKKKLFRLLTNKFKCCATAQNLIP